jgi:hypothetical protein
MPRRIAGFSALNKSVSLPGPRRAGFVHEYHVHDVPDPESCREGVKPPRRGHASWVSPTCAH